jgi:hypothetical protein
MSVAPYLRHPLDLVIDMAVDAVCVELGEGRRIIAGVDALYRTIDRVQVSQADGLFTVRSDGGWGWVAC